MNTRPPARFHTTVIQSSRVFPQPTPPSSDRILSSTRSPRILPLCLECLGGQWEGTFISWGKEKAHVQILGFPPLERFQIMQLQYLDYHREYPLLLFQAAIEDIHLENGSSPWEGMTHMVLKCQVGNEELINCFPPINSGLRGKINGRIWGRIVLPSSWNTHSIQSVCSPPPPGFQIVHQKTVAQEMTVSARHSGIISTPLTIKRDNGQHISAYHDRRIDGGRSNFPVVVISPGYGETKREYLTLAYFFASNGFQVVRYDHTNHVGESDGVHYDVSLSSMKEDFQTVTGFVRKAWPHALPISVASSLASRAVLKAEAECPSVSLLIMLMGIVNVHRSAATVHQEDLFAGYVRGQYPDSANFLGFNVGNQFLRDALVNEFVTLEQTLNDAKHLNCHLIGVSAEKDAWVAPDDLQVFRKALGGRVQQWIEVPDALHRLQENPKRAREVYRDLVTACLQQATGKLSPATFQSPSRLELGRQNRVEKLALKRQAELAVGPAFWQDYLNHFQTVDTCPDYIKLLDHLFHALGPMIPGQRILDAGCGNGNTGMFLLHILRSQSLRNSFSRDQDELLQYVGIDIIPEALKRANHSMTGAIAELPQNLSLLYSGMKADWAQVDLNRPLPFPDNHFHRIISNLVLGYLEDPRAALAELYRVLAPGGRMVISTLKPDGDFSGIYQSLVQSAAIPQQRAEARELLNNYGKIRQAEKEGQFCFYHPAQWESIAADLGCKNARIFPTFAGQAYLLVLEKPAVDGQISSPVASSDRSTISDPAANLWKQVA